MPKSLNAMVRYSFFPSIVVVRRGSLTYARSSARSVSAMRMGGWVRWATGSSAERKLAGDLFWREVTDRRSHCPMRGRSTDSIIGSTKIMPRSLELAVEQSHCDMGTSQSNSAEGFTPICLIFSRVYCSVV